MTELQVDKRKIHLSHVTHFISVREACAIPDPENEEVIITGGSKKWNIGIKIVSVYSEAGWQKDMTPLNHERRGHGCSSFLSKGDRVREGCTFLG